MEVDKTSASFNLMKSLKELSTQGNSYRQYDENVKGQQLTQLPPKLPQEGGYKRKRIIGGGEGSLVQLQASKSGMFGGNDMQYRAD
jgi:hypothetical protein